MEKSSRTSRWVKIQEKSSRTWRRVKIHKKLITNMETGQKLKKWSRRSRWMNKTQAEDRVQDTKEFVQNELMEFKIGTRNTQRIRDEHADRSKIGARRIERIRDELVDGSKVTARKHKRIDGDVPDGTLNLDDGLTEQYVN